MIDIHTYICMRTPCSPISVIQKKNTKNAYFFDSIYSNLDRYNTLYKQKLFVLDIVYSMTAKLSQTLYKLFVNIKNICVYLICVYMYMYVYVCKYFLWNLLIIPGIPRLHFGIVRIAIISLGRLVLDQRILLLACKLHLLEQRVNTHEYVDVQS